MKMKLLASVKGETITALLNEAVEEYLRKHEGELRKKVSEVVNE